ncbi:MAG: glycosyltransferase family 4 protein [Bacteroidales bacterium]
MHIAYISYEYPPDTGKGGIGTYTFQIANMISELGHFVEIFTASNTRNISELINRIMVHRILVNNNSEFNQLVAIKFGEQHHLNPFDCIECAEIGSNAEVIKIKFPEIPLIVRLHTPAVLVVKMQNTYLPLFSKLRFVAGALISGKIDLGYWSKFDKNRDFDPDYLITKKAVKISAPSNLMKNWAVSFWKINPDRIEVISNPFIPDQKLLSIPINTESKRITFIGRLNVLKGVVSLTKSLPLIFSKHPDWKMRFIGANESSHIKGLDMKSWILDNIKEFNQNVEFVDWIEYEQLSLYYSETDICVFPSLFESFSYVCAEAMSAGKAIVGSRNSAMVDLLEDGECGILVNPKSNKQIADGINYLIENPEKREEYGIKARKRILDEYNAVIIGKKMEMIYLNIFKS